MSREGHERLQAEYGPRLLSYWSNEHDPEGGPGWTKSKERPLGKWLCRLTKRNTFYFHAHLQFGFSIGFVTRWKVRYAPSFIRDVAKITGRHPVVVAEAFTKSGREIVAQERVRAG